jgi:hypothetical protein
VTEGLMNDMLFELLIRENKDVEEVVHFATDNFFNLERDD